MRTFPRPAAMIFLMLIGMVSSVVGPAHGRQEPALTDVPTATTRKQDNRVWARFPEVKDALARYKAQMGDQFEASMAHRSIQVMLLADRICVQFQLDLGNVGGTPVWCYAGDAAVALRPRQLRLVYDGSRAE